MSYDAKVEVNIDPQFGVNLREAITYGVTQMLVYDAWPDAVKNSPVAAGKQHGGKYVGGGTNRRSITVEVVSYGEQTLVKGGAGTDKDGKAFEATGGVAEKVQHGVSGAIFTQSGYGGWLEAGHMARRSHIGPPRFVQGRPYMYPAVEKNGAKVVTYASEFMERLPK